MQTPSELDTRFKKDIEDIAQIFIDKFNLKFDKEDSNSSSALLRWLDFTNRYIPMQKRKIFYSDKFLNSLQELDNQTRQEFNKIEQLILEGKDINPYQSKGLILHNDTSSSKRQNRTDFLYADWCMHHLHLNSTIPNGDYFSTRSNWLLFIFVQNLNCYFIDIRSHNDEDLFSDQNLVITLIKNWPNTLEHCVLKDATPPSNNFSNQDLGRIRKSGVNLTITYNGKVYVPPGGGITTANTSTRATFYSSIIFMSAKQIADQVLSPSNKYLSEAKSKGIFNPEFSLKIKPKGLAIYESKTGLRYFLPRNGDDFYPEINNLLSPQWAIDHIYKS